ncbi:hypothetical protein, partial [Pseudomonas syringae]|uniref:hypothetical protein n=1 Tax=Pseudomonas syringae TaxID=317 RepID=UPI001C802240
FETYVYAQTLSIAKHAPFVHVALSTAHAQAHDAKKSVSKSLVKDGGVAGTIQKRDAGKFSRRRRTGQARRERYTGLSETPYQA